LAFVLFLGLAAPAVAADFYVDPVNGTDAGDGSAQAPWKSLQEVWDAGLIETRGWDELPYDETRQLVAKNAGAPVGPGDTIWLRDGYHGAVEIQGAYNADRITIAAESGHTPELASIRLRAASGWVLQGLSISPSHAPEYEKTTMVVVENHNWHGPSSEVTVEDCTIFSVEDTSQWTADDWVQKASSGVSASGDDVTVRRNRLDNVRMGISMSGERAHVARNEIVNFSADGLRGLGDDSVFEYNLVKNCYDVDDNHDDGFQSWSNGDDGVGSGEVSGMVLRGNTIINYEDPDQPHRGPLQGIGCFDGTYTDWVVENNVIVVDHWHGITLMGAKGGRIVNNTVIDLNDERPGPPWIQIAPHKNGTPSANIVVRNNLATAISIGDDQPSVVDDHNLIVDDLAAFFVDPAALDLRLLESAAAVDTGSSELAPAIDRDGVPRPQGEGYDLGAYEYHDGESEPADAGAAPDTGSLDAGGSDAGAPSTDTGTSQDVSISGDTAGGADAEQQSSSGDQAEGCSCRTVSTTPSAPWWLASCLVIAGWGLRRRKRA
jgi:MYXO-CTERM domain-containing protein